MLNGSKLHAIWLSICILAVLVVGFGVYGWQQRKVGAQNALAKEAAQKLDLNIAEQRDSDRARARQDSVAQRTITVTRQKLDVFRLRADSLLTLKDSLVAKDSLRLALQVADTIIGAQQTQILSLVQALSIAQGRWEAADSSAQAWKAVALSAQGQLAASLKRGAPRFGCFVGAGLSIGLGYGTGATVGCGLRI